MTFPYPGTLLLGGGGSEEISAVFDKEFTARLEKEVIKILYVPIAWSADPATYPSCYDWFMGALKANGLSRAQVTMQTDLSDFAVSQVGEYDAMYIGGGNTYNLLNAIVTSKFDEVIKKFLAAGKVVYGGSAGAIIMAKSICTVIEENELGDAAHECGLNLIEGASIRCHYTATDIPLIEKFLSHVPAIPVIAIPESSGLVVTAQGIKVAGLDEILVFEFGSAPTRYSVGQSLSL